MKYRYRLITTVVIVSKIKIDLFAANHLADMDDTGKTAWPRIRTTSILTIGFLSSFSRLQSFIPFLKVKKKSRD